MNEPTSAVLAERARLHAGGRHTVAWSIAGHGVALALIALGARSSSAPVRQVMTVSLSGAPGARTGGQTQMGGAAAAPVSPKPPAPTPPPEEPRPAPPKAVVPPPRPATRPTAPTTARTPAATPEPATGNTPTVTGARGQGFGLSSRGGSAGRNVELDVSNFCCPDYLEKMVLAIQRGWDKNQGTTGVAVIAFTIRRDGTVESPAVRRPSGFFALDNAALRAVARANRLPPLPSEFPESTLAVRLTFEYQQ